MSISHNGRLLLDILEPNDLILVNGIEKCQGKITRIKYHLDYFVVCEGFFQLIKDMCADEDRIYVLAKYYKVKVTQSDHKPIYLVIDIPWDTTVVKQYGLKYITSEIVNVKQIILNIQGVFGEVTKSISFVLEPVGIPGARMGGKIIFKHIHLNYLLTKYEHL